MMTHHETATLFATASARERTMAGSARQQRRLPPPEPLCLAPEEADRIAVRVMGRLAGQLKKLRILVRRDGYVLQGRVHSYYAKQLVQEAVRKMTDRPIAENSVEVV